MNIVSAILKLVSLGLVIGAAALWVGAVNSRPKNRDKHTLVGGALWTQTLIPIGLIISAIVDDYLDAFVHAYYLFAGWLILGLSGIMLIVEESKKFKKQRRSTIVLNTLPPQLHKSFDRTYLAIGVLTSLASIITFVDFILIVINNL